MNEKRFQIKDSNSYHVGYDIIDYQNFYKRYYGGRLVQAEELCDLLNEQHEEITQLKFQLQNTSDQRDEFYRGARENANRVGKLERENKELKLLVQNWEALDEEKDGQLDKQNQALKKLKKENEQLKEFIDELYKKYEDAHGMNIENTDWF